jgi:Leucine Rich repeat
LETLNLSDNTITAPIWKCWSSQRTLHQLILDYVEMDDDSLTSLANNFTFADTLEELYVVLTQNIGPCGLIAANAILKACRNIGSLRWAVKDAPPDSFMPWRGLADMAHGMSNTGGSYLLHLVMDGGTLSEEDAGPLGLAGALEHLSQLKTLKLRSIGLTDLGVQHLARALSIAQPALDVLDLSRNVVQSAGAAALSTLSDLEPLTKHLTCFSLERNHIDAEGARKLLEAFGMSKTNPKLDIKLDGNPIHFSKFAFQLAQRKGQVQLERDQLYQKLHGGSFSQNHQRLDSSIASRPDLQEQVRQLQEEKVTLLRAFCMLGNSNQMEEQVRWMNRVVALETLVLRQNQMAEKENTDHSAPALARQSVLQPIPFTDLSSPTTCDAFTQPALANHPMHRIDPPMTPGGGFRNMLRSPMPMSKPKVGASVGERWAASPGGLSPKKKWTAGSSILPSADGPSMQSPSAAGLSGYLKHQLNANTINSNNSRKSPSVASSYGGHGDEVSKAGFRSTNGKSSVDRSSGPRMPAHSN